MFRERSLCSVAANTRRDGTEFLAIAAPICARALPQPEPYDFDNADVALRDLAAGVASRGVV